MARPKRRKRIKFDPEVTYFKPRGVPMRDLEEVSLTEEEMEAIRLKNTKDLTQTEAAERMNTSQSTFQRILSSSHKKIAKALVEGKAIKINKK